MSLDYIPPELVEGNVTIKLDKEKTDKEIDKWKSALIVYVIRATPSYNYMKKYVKKKWKLLRNLKSIITRKATMLLNFPKYRSE